MRIHSKLSYLWCDKLNEYVLVAEEGFDICPENGLALCKGSDAAQNNLANQQSQFYSTLSNDYNTQFQNQGNILSSLNNALSPTVAAGPNQFGYSPAQVNALNSTAIQGTAQSYNQAQKALQNQEAAQGGGNMQLPSGVAEQNNATLASQGANQKSSELLGIQNAGFAQGNQNYNSAIGQLGGVAGMYNPTGYAGSANGAGSSADSEANLIQQENQAASPMGILGGVLGGIGSIAGTALGGPLGGAIGGKIGGLFGGGGSGGGGATQTDMDFSNGIG